MRNSQHQRLLKRLLEESLNPANDDQTRALFAELYEWALDAEETWEDLIWEAENIGLRFPDFPGDMIGRPSDDYEDYYGLDEEEDED